MVDLAAQLLTGGLVIQSTWDAGGSQPALYAQTVIQMDGDVVTIYHEDLMDRPDCELLTGNHLKKVFSAMAPLKHLANLLARTRHAVWGMSIVSAVIGYLSGNGLTGGWHCDFWLITLFFGVTGLAIKPIFFKLLQYRVQKIWAEAKKDAEQSSFLHP